MNPSLISYLIERSQQRLLVSRPERKLLAENIDLKIETYVGVVENEWPLPNSYWFGEARDISQDVAEIEYEWQVMKGKYGL
jgi:hypothetical protein